MLWTSDADGRWTYINRAWTDFAGRAGEHQAASDWADAIHPEDAGRSVDECTAAFDRRLPFELEYRLRRRDGEYRWIFDQGVPRFHADGAFAGYIGSAFDVTERKLGEEALSMVSRRLIEAQEEERAAAGPRAARRHHATAGPRGDVPRSPEARSGRRRAPRGDRRRQQADRRSHPGYAGALASPALVEARSGSRFTADGKRRMSSTTPRRRARHARPAPTESRSPAADRRRAGT